MISLDSNKHSVQHWFSIIRLLIIFTHTHEIYIPLLSILVHFK